MLWQTLRLFIFYKLYRTVRKYLLNKLSFGKWLTLASLIGALLVGKFLSRIVDKLLEFFMNYKPMLGIDAIFLQNNLKNQAPVVSGVWRTDKFEVEYMKNYILMNFCGNVPNVEKLPRTKSKVVDVFGKSYWVQMTDAEFQIAKITAYIVVDGIHNKKDLEDFVAKEMLKDVDLRKELPYKFYFIPNYNEDSSIIIFLTNHAFCDGVSLYPIMTALTVEKDFSQQYSVGELPWHTRLYNELMLPISVV